MSDAYKIITVRGPLMRMDSRGQAEGYYSLEGVTTGGVPFRLDVADAEMDAEALRPILAKKASQLDAVKGM